MDIPWKDRDGFFDDGRKLRILTAPANKGGCAYYRVISPYAKLAELYPNVVEIREDLNPLGRFIPGEEKLAQEAGSMWRPNWTFENMKWADVIVLNNISNYGGEYTARVVGKAKEFGKFVHYDTDDLLTDLYDEHRLVEIYKEKQLDKITQHIYNHSDLVTVTQDKFAQRIKPFCSSMLGVIKNSIDYELPCWRADRNNYRPSQKGAVRIGWAGGIHHDPDVKVFSGVPHLVNQMVGASKVQWDFYGFPQVAKEEIWQQKVWHGYKTQLLKGFKKTKNYNIHYALPPDQYGIMYANMDIAIAPLQMNDFNDSKSDIKVAEAGRYSVPLVASNVGCYSDTITNGKTGYLLDPEASPREWAKIIADLIKNKAKRESLGANLNSITDEMFDMNKVVVDRLSMYEHCFKTTFNPMDNRNDVSESSNQDDRQIDPNQCSPLSD